MLDTTDYNNILAIMARVEYKGLDEAKVAAVLSHKIESIVGAYEDKDDGSDVPDPTE